MNAQPSLPSVSWTTPVALEILRENRQRLPNTPGVYVFTNFAGPLVQGPGILYIGKATNLAKRVSTYLADPANTRIWSQTGNRLSTSIKHAGKVLLLTKIQQKSRGGFPPGIWVRWITTGSVNDADVDVAAETHPHAVLRHSRPLRRPLRRFPP